MVIIMQELRGMPVVQALADKLGGDMRQLRQAGITPKLAIVRVGGREDDLAYERGIVKRFAAVGAVAQTTALRADCTQQELEQTVTDLNNDISVHGILLFRPLPKPLSEERIKAMISAEKDVDCMGTANMAHVFAADRQGYPPCTPQAVVEILDYYKIDVTGKKITIVGRSLVVGKPLAMLLLGKNATVTVCHTKTRNLPEECRRADVLICCSGVAKMIRKDDVSPGQIVIDVGIHMDQGKLCGDVDYAGVADIVGAITPVPGGVGTVTTSVLLKHTIQSALKQLA